MAITLAAGLAGGTVAAPAFAGTTERTASAASLPQLPNYGAPYIFGRGDRVGQVWAAYPGAWPDGTSVSYQWKRNGIAIPGSTAPSHTLTGADDGTHLSVTATGSKPGYAPRSVTSKSYYQAVSVQYATYPSVAGTKSIGRQLTVNPGVWESPVTFKYQWVRANYSAAGDTLIPGATGRTYTSTTADHGENLRVRVTATNARGVHKTVTVPIGVLSPGLMKWSSPTLSGSAVVGKTLTARPGTWTKGARFGYQWLRNGTAIKGATAASYKVTSADAGRVLAVQITGSLPGYVTSFAASKPSAKVVYGTVANTRAPSVSGTAKVGYTLKANAGKWSSGAKVSYQWLANGKSIKGATASSYKIAKAYKGKKISVKVTGSKTAYAPRSVVSKTTANVR